MPLVNLVFHVYTEPLVQTLKEQLQCIQANILVFVSLQVLVFWWVRFLTDIKNDSQVVL